MQRKYRTVIVILVLLSMPPDPVFGSFMRWRPFVVRADLAPVKIVQRTTLPAAFIFEKFTTDNQDPVGAINGEGEGKERNWGEFQFGSIRFHISRYHDPQLGNDSIRSSAADSVWETMKLLPVRLGDFSSRENLEAMGKIFAPQLDLGIEF